MNITKYSNLAFESVVADFPKDVIDFTLQSLGPNVEVVASRMTEDGYELLLEGDAKQVSELVYALGQGVK